MKKTPAAVVRAADARQPMKINWLALLEAGQKAEPSAPRREVKKPDLLPMVLPSPEAMAFDAANDPAALGPYMALDDQSVAPLYTFANQFQCGLGFPGYAYLSELAQRSEYRAPAETLGGEMTRKWVKIISKGKGDKADKIAQLEDAMQRFDVQKHFRKLAYHDNFFGRAQLYVAIKGQMDDKGRQLPLVVDSKTIAKDSLVGFNPIEPIWTTPYTYNSLDPTLPDFFKPKAWYILGKKTHHTRLLTIVSREVPDILKPAYNFGGISLTQLIEPYVVRWLRTVQSVNDLIHNFSITALKTNMQATLEGDPSDDILKRAQFFNQTRDNKGLMLLDFDHEDIVKVDTPLSGLSELQAQAQEHMAAPTHIPLVKLTGITPDGLNASSEGEIQVFYDYIKAKQEEVFDDPFTTVLNILQLNEFGAIDPDIGHEWVPLDELSGKEQAEVRKSDAEAGQGYVDRGVISPDEERERLMLDPNSGYTNLSGPAPEPPEPEVPPGGGGGFGGEGGDAEA